MDPIVKPEELDKKDSPNAKEAAAEELSLDDIDLDSAVDSADELDINKVDLNDAMDALPQEPEIDLNQIDLEAAADSPEALPQVIANETPEPEIPAPDMTEKLLEGKTDISKFARDQAINAATTYLDYLGMPDRAVRAFVGRVQMGAGLEAAVDAAVNQFGPTTNPQDIPSYKQMVYNGMIDMGIDPDFALPSAKVIGPPMDIASSVVLDFSNVFGAGPLRPLAKSMVKAAPKSAAWMAKRAATAFNNLDDETLPIWIKRYHEVEAARPYEEIAKDFRMGFEDIQKRTKEAGIRAREALDADQFLAYLQSVRDPRAQGLTMKQVENLTRMDIRPFIDIYDEAIDSVGAGARLAPDDATGRFVLIGRKGKKQVVDELTGQTKIVPAGREGIPQTGDEEKARKRLQALKENFLKLVNPENNTVSQHEFKDILQKLDTQIDLQDLQGLGETDETLALIHLRSGIDGLLKDENPFYKKLMETVDDGQRVLAQARTSFRKDVKKEGATDLAKTIEDRIKGILNKPNSTTNQDKIRFFEMIDERAKTNLLQEAKDRRIYEQLNGRNIQGSRITTPLALAGGFNMLRQGLEAGTFDLGSVAFNTLLGASGFVLDRYGKRITRELLRAGMETKEFQKRYISKVVGLDFLPDSKMRTFMRTIRPGAINTIIRQLSGEDSAIDQAGNMIIRDQTVMNGLEMDIMKSKDISTNEKYKAINRLREDYAENGGLVVQWQDTEPDQEKPAMLRRKKSILDLNRAFGAPIQDDGSSFTPQVPGLPNFGGIGQ